MTRATILTEPSRRSYFIVGRHLCRTLRQAGVAAVERTLPAGKRQRADLARECDGRVVIQSTIGPLFMPLPGCVNVALPHHEWSRYPSGWVDRLNGFDAVWTASRFVARALRDSGVTAPLAFVPPALDLEAVPQKSGWATDGPFRFLACGEPHFRKGFHLLIAGFMQAFPTAGEATLTIKTSAGCPWESPRADIRILARNLSRGTLLSMYREFDAYVSASLGEGLDLPAAEAVLAGLPVVMSRWGGHADLLKPGAYVELAFRSIDQPFASQPSYYAAGQRCAFSSPTRIADALRRAVETSARDRARMAAAARPRLLAAFGTDAACHRLRRAWKSLGVP
jgi:glycosyltransferase involved in cell wall biosynthesis